ncbi:Protease 4 [Mannheimia haemolytica]|uniref:Protease 4 n=1 Tax=Mannheimia haemolytica TaxID=75985 RepID=A0A378MW55_MANHA|nr:Protease 4 [Mannheimia haemolytica]
MLTILKAFYRIFRCIRECVINLFFILFILLLVPVVAFISSSGSTQKPVFNQGALRLNLDGYLADNREEFTDFYRLVQSELGSSEPFKSRLLMWCKRLATLKMTENYRLGVRSAKATKC